MDRYEQVAREIVSTAWNDMLPNANKVERSVAQALRDEWGRGRDAALRAAESADGAGVARGRDVACNQIRALRADDEPGTEQRGGGE